jgi:NAD(P)-dependent dehydrogenase (short-subunit alcohol dehydrogenase family)
MSNSTANSKVYFVTGANRGIGLNLVKTLKNEGIVFATARNPEGATELNELAKENKNIHVIKLDVNSKRDNEKAAEEVKKIVDKVDVLYVNAGIANSYAPITVVEEDDLERHFRTNVFGAIFTFQAIYPLLQKGSDKTVVFVSTIVASLLGFLPFITGSYGPSKAALNHVVRQIDLELKDSGFKVVAIHPGLVSSDMGSLGLEQFKKTGVDISAIPVITPESSASQIVKTVNALDKSTGAEFLNYDGSEAPW